MRKVIGVLLAGSLLAGAGWMLVAEAAPRVLVANMNGEKEVSPEGERGAGDPDGTGRAVIRVFRADNRVCFNLGWNNIDPPTMSHIHSGDANSTGPPVVTLFDTGDETAEGDQDLPATLSGVRGCMNDVSPDVIRSIVRNPNGHYVNVHNDEYPGGAIRGQLRRRR